jgi:thiosulfate/3-mercaptopyruvate sulfurtransferase
MTQDDGYPHAELLVDTDWLGEHAGDAGLALIDCGTAEAYNRAHIPGAVGLPVIPQIKDPTDDVHVMPAGSFAELMGQLGVGDDTLVVAYDSNNSLWAARLWWTLRYYGHHNAKVLNGGWHKWIAEGRPVATEPARPAPATFTPRQDSSVICSLTDLLARAGSGSTGILDVRSAEEFAGTNSRGNRRTGHVPGAAHIEWLDFMTSDERRVFRPAEQMRAMLARADITPQQEVITYCQAGIRAAHVFFVLSLLGYDRVRNYDGSMREWANRDETPLVLPA